MAIVSLTTTKPALLTATSRLLTLDRMGYQAALIAMAAIAIVLLIPPFIWHIRALNIPLITLICWLLLMDIKTFIDAIIWGGEDFKSRYNGVGYCDVMVRIQVGANVGISSSIAGVMFNLYRILKADSALPTLKSFKKVAVDLVISLLTPVIVMGLNYLVMIRRFSILQYSGCQGVTSLSWVTVVLYSMWMVIWSLVSVIFAVLIIFVFFKKRKDIKDILQCTNSGLNLVRFSRLLIFCCIIAVVMLPLSLFIFVDGLSNVENTYDFDIIHSQAIWGVITFVPLSEPYYITWIYLALSYVVFIFFGLGSDAIDMYLKALCRIGLGGAIEYLRRKKAQRMMLKADWLVGKTLNGKNPPSSSAEYSTFDIEMQKALDDNDLSTIGKSPISINVGKLGSGNRYDIREYISSSGNAGLFDELDDDDMDYLRMLCEQDSSKQAGGSSQSHGNGTDHSAKSEHNTSAKSHSLELYNCVPETLSTCSGELGYSYVVKQKH